MFLYLTEIAFCNAYVLHVKISSTQKTSTISFRLAIAAELLGQLSLLNYKCHGYPSNIDAPLRLQAKNLAHFPEKIPSTKSKMHPTKRCHVCYKQKIRKETVWQCKQCQVPLHLPTCFEKYHTLHNY